MIALQFFLATGTHGCVETARKDIEQATYSRVYNLPQR
jgi:hypothetical protein